MLLIGPLGTNFSEVLIKPIHFHSRTLILKSRRENNGHFVNVQNKGTLWYKDKKTARN